MNTLKQNAKRAVVFAIKKLLLNREGIKEEDVDRKLRSLRRIARVTFRNLFVERQGTYCPKLWDSAFIDQYGNAFNCCYSRPSAIGNIYEKDLGSIWQRSIRLRVLRFLSLHKALYCAHGCDLISPEEKNARRPFRPHLPHPSNVRILYGERCNLACTMCWQNHTDAKTIDKAVVQKHIGWEHVKDMELQGGEILVMKEAKELFLWMTETKNKKVNLITNGVLMNRQWAQHLAAGANWVQISVNAATKEIHELVNRKSNFQRVTENIRTLVSTKRETGSAVQVVYKYTIVPENVFEIPSAIVYANELGCDKIAFGYDPVTVPAFLNKNPALKSRLQLEIGQSVSAGMPIEIEALRLQSLDLL